MQKNVSGQTIGAQMVSATDGSAFTGSVTVHVTGDGGTQATGSVGSGACMHEGNGYHSYAPAQAETNYNHVAFTFTGTGAVPVTIQVATRPPNFQALSIDSSGNANANVTEWLGTTAQGGDGYPSVNVVFINWANAMSDVIPPPTEAEIQAYLDAYSQKLASLPTNVSPGSNGGLPTVDANNRVAGIAGTITTLDALDTAQDAQHAATKGDTAATRALAEGATGFAAIKGVADSTKTVTDALSPRLPGSGTIAVAADVPSAAANRAEMDANSTMLAGIGTAVGTTLPALIGSPDLSLAADIASIKTDTGTTIPAAIGDIEGGGTTQPRINRKPDPGFTIQVSRRTDGTYKCPKPIRLTAGAVDNVYVFIDMTPLFGPDNFVETVGTASVSTGSITEGSEKGPRDTYAVLELDGTADDDCEITVPVTMESGTTVPVVFDVEVLGQ